MRLALVLGVIGRLLLVFSLAFLAPLAMATWDAIHEIGTWWECAEFAIAAGITLVGGLILRSFSKTTPDFRRAEALAVVAGSWFVLAHFAAIPYFFAGLGYVDAFFESMSGLTATGATILQDFNQYGRGFFLWRSMTQWFGGLGVIALFVVVLPQLGVAGRQIMFAEGSDATADVISPSVRESARRLWLLYVFLTLCETTLLHSVAGMTLYDSICHAMTTMSAGGFSPHPDSIAGYANPAAEWILIVFMTLSGMSFPLIWIGLTRRPKEFLRDGEFRFYMLALCTCALILAVLLSSKLPGEESIRTSLFQTTSLISSTGYASVDYAKEPWNDSMRALLVMIMLVGGCAGSAAGGTKAIRALLSLKFMWRELTRVLHPRGVIPLRHRGRPVPEEVMRAILNLVMCYVLTYLVVGLSLALLGNGLATSFTASLACVGNIGPGFGHVGPMDNFTAVDPIARYILTLGMWMGRLELIAVLVLLHPHVLRSIRWGGSKASAKRA